MSPPLDALVGFFETLTPASLGRVAEIYAPDAKFCDPFNEVQGVRAVEQIFRHMFAQVDQPRFVVLESYEQAPRAVLLWEFTFRFRGQRAERKVEGMSRVVFDDCGRVASHRDYWDAAGGVYAELPVLGTLMRFLRRGLGAGA